MEEKAYPFHKIRTQYKYEFFSQSAKKIIKKVVVFTDVDSDVVFNLALLDVLDNGKLSDIIESNNNDLPNVMATVIKIVEDFLIDHPNNIVLFKGSDLRRQRLYRIIISREINLIQIKFRVMGVIDDVIEDFVPNREYDYFIISKIINE